MKKAQWDKMFQIIKECLEKSSLKWDLGVENSLRKNVNNACKRLQLHGKDAEELVNLQELLYAIYTAVSKNDMARKFIKVGIHIMIEKIFDAVLSEKQQGKNEWEIIEEQILDVVNALAEGLTEDRDSLLMVFCPKCVDLILKKQVNYLHGIEVLKGCNMIMETCTLATKEKLLQRADILDKLRGIAAKLETLGDYECQVGILECLFRIIPRKLRMNFVKKIFGDGEILHKFTLIRDAHFETDCRIFLNEFNASQTQQLVYSFPCAEAVLGDKELVKPDDDEYEYFWVDFNTETKRITLFCEQINDSERDGDFWETISIRNEDVKEVKFQKRNGSIDFEIMFEKPIRVLFPSQSSVKGQHMNIHFPSDTDIELVVDKTLPDCCNVIESSQKASTVEFPVRISRDYFQEIQKPVEKNICKVSSPCTPMHLIQDSWCKERTETVEDYIDVESNKQRMKKADKDSTHKYSSKIYENQVSTSSKASNTASPLKISSASPYPSGCGKKEPRATTPKLAGGKKKKVKTPVVTVTPPVKRFRSNVQQKQKTERRKKESKKATRTSNDVKLPLKNDVNTEVQKVRVMKEVPAAKGLPEQNCQTTRSRSKMDCEKVSVMKEVSAAKGLPEQNCQTTQSQSENDCEKVSVMKEVSAAKGLPEQNCQTTRSRSKKDCEKVSVMKEVAAAKGLSKQNCQTTQSQSENDCEKVRVMKKVLAEKGLHEQNCQTTGSHSEMDCFDSDFDAATEGIIISDSSQEDLDVKSNNSETCLVKKNTPEIIIKGDSLSNSLKKYASEEVENSKESVGRKTMFALDDRLKGIKPSIDRNTAESSTTNVPKNLKPKKLPSNDTESCKSKPIEKVESTIPSNDKDSLNARKNALHGVEMKMEQAEQTVGKEMDSETDNDVCLLTRTCINVVSNDDDDTMGIGNEQEAEIDIDVENKQRKKYVMKNRPSKEVASQRKNCKKKQEGKNRKPVKACKQQQLSPVVVIKRLDEADYYNFDSNVKRTEKTAVETNTDQNVMSRGRPKGSKKKYAKSQSAVEEKASTKTCIGSQFSLSDKTKHNSNHRHQNRDSVFEWKNSDEDGDSYTSKSISLANAKEKNTDEENEVDFVQESQNIATKAPKVTCDKSLDTDLSFKESPWYKCMPQNSKYNTKWFKTYGKARGKQRQITGGSQGIGSSGDSPAMQKFSQQMTKTLSVQMTYSSQCISSPGGDAHRDPYIFDDNISEYSNNLMLSSQQKIIKQKSVKRKKVESNKKSNGLVYANKKGNVNKWNGSNEVFGERKKLIPRKSKKSTNKMGDSNSCDSSDGSSFSNHECKDQEKSAPNSYQIEKVSRVSRGKPKSKKSKTTDRQTYRHRGYDDNSDYTITCNASPLEECDDVLMTSPVLEAQLNSLESWKPTNTYSLMNRTTENFDNNLATDRPSPITSPTPRKKRKMSKHTKQHVDSSLVNTSDIHPNTPESILLKFRKDCQKLVEESFCSEENEVARLQTPLIPVSPYIEQKEQCEMEDQLVSSPRSKISQESQESIEKVCNPLKWKHREMECNSFVEEDQVETVCEVNWLRGFQATHQHERSDDKRKDVSVSISTASSQDIDSVISEKMSTFGVEVQHQFQAKKIQLDTLTKDTLRSLRRICLKCDKETREMRTKCIEEFQQRVSLELKDLEKDVSSLKKTEDECLLYFEEKLRDIQRHTHSQEKSIQSLMAAKESFVKQLHHSEEHVKKSQFTVKNSMKKELDALKARLISRKQQEELDNIKLCLQRSFSIGQ